MNVLIFEKDNGQVKANIPISLEGLNYNPSEREYFRLAWENAISDGLVKKDKFDKFSFKITD